MEYIVFVFKNEEDLFVAALPDIEDCVAYAETLEEILEAIQDAAEIYLENEELPKANRLEHFTDTLLAKLSIPLDSSKYIVKITEDGDKSYNAELVLDC